MRKVLKISLFFHQPALEDGCGRNTLILDLLDKGRLAFEDAEGLLVVVHQEFTYNNKVSSREKKCQAMFGELDNLLFMMEYTCMANGGGKGI